MKHSTLGLSTLLLGSLLAGTTGCGSPVQLPPPSYDKQTVFRASSREIQGYYQEAQGKSGKDLLSALAGIVKKHTDLGYSGARSAMFDSVDDYQDDDTVECAYTGRRAANVDSTDSASSASMNTEHTWPQSLGAEGPAKADLHHLFPTDIKTNGARNSFPFGEVNSSGQSFPQFDVNEGTSLLGLDAQGDKVFEPRIAHKGNVARALLYFYTCYAANGRVELRNFRIERDTLLRWNKTDPVDAAEKLRNDKIFQVQGNRNPFVDHPEYVEAVGDFPIQ